LDRLIDISTTTEHPIVIQDDDGNDIGVIDKTTLLKGIQGGKA
jgi:glycine betaine/proline transport system ATP-binding protein